MKIEVIEPHGFCRGVAAAIRLAEKALVGTDPAGRGTDPAGRGTVPMGEGTVPKGVYCLHELVHNEMVISRLKKKGLIFFENIDEVPEGAKVIFSAHGVSPEVREKAAARRLEVIDATCPFVSRVHREARRYAEAGMPVVVIGHKGHVEVAGVVGEVESAGGVARVVISPREVETLPFDENGGVGVVSQTTLAVADVGGVMEALAKRFPHLECSAASEACTATHDRQQAVADFVRGGGDGVLVLGSVTSSNTRRLAEVAQAAGAGLVVRAASLAEVAAMDFSGIRRLGVTSGASTPEDFLNAVVDFLSSRSGFDVWTSTGGDARCPSGGDSQRTGTSVVPVGAIRV